MSNNIVQQTVDAFSDYWLNSDAIDKYVKSEEKGHKEATFSMDLIHLAAYRRVISNFVTILTGQNIPVQFVMTGDENWTDGKTVWLSSSVKRKSDFDWNVGLALHEGSHILLSDFDLVKLVFNKIPQELKSKAKAKNVTLEQLAYLSKWVFNVIEDRYVDSYVFHEAPGYRGYYKAMYDRLWNSPTISKALKSKMYRKPNLLAYELRVINLTNPDQDLDALLGLREIAELIDLTNIFRLKSTRERMEVAFKVVDIIVENLGKQPKPPKQDSLKDVIDKVTDMISKAGGKGMKGSGSPGSSKKSTEKKKSDDDADDKKDKKGGKGKSKKKDKKDGNDDDDSNSSASKSDSSDDSDNPPFGDDADRDKVDSNASGDKSKDNEPTDDSDDSVDEGDVSEFNQKDLKKIREDFEKQKELLKHDYRKVKEKITAEEKALLDVIEKFGIVLVATGFGMGGSKPGDYNHAAVDSIVVQKLTKDLILQGSTVFPMAAVHDNDLPYQRYEDAINKGWALGKILGKRLQIRGEENITKFIRKVSGKIERRLLAGIGAGLEDVFNKTIMQRYNKARLHISVDASSSMDTDSKWIPTMTCLTAICVAASMVENLAISVSFRTTHRLSDGTELPYIVLAYDSDKDKIAKVKQIFPYLKACGCTPEGLAFEAIMDKFIVGKKCDGQDHYFLNLSDGEPYYTLTSRNNRYKTNFDYSGESAALHTKKQVEKMRFNGVKVLSYFISSDGVMAGRYGYNPSAPAGGQIPYNGTLGGQFQKMYGKDAKYIDVTSVFDIAKTINRLFLSQD